MGAALGDVLVEVPRRAAPRARVEHADPRPRKIAAHAGRLSYGLETVVVHEITRALEAHVVLGVGVRDIDLPGYRMRGHAEENRSDMRERRRDLYGGIRVGIGVQRFRAIPVVWGAAAGTRRASSTWSAVSVALDDWNTILNASDFFPFGIPSP